MLRLEAIDAKRIELARASAVEHERSEQRGRRRGERGTDHPVAGGQKRARLAGNLADDR